MSKKGGGSSYTPQVRNDGIDQDMLVQMFQGMAGMMSGMMESFSGQITALTQQMQQQMTAMPEINKAPEVDWTNKLSELNAKTKADYALETARKKGIANSVYTSPLLDSEDAETTYTSLVAGR